MRSLILVVALWLSFPAAAQPGVRSLQDRMNSVAPHSTTPAECAREVGKATTLNGPDLLYGAALCFAADRPVEGNFMLSAGQIRATADMSLMMPASRADSEIAMSLYGFIYASAGGPGQEGVFRDRALREQFFRLFDRWTPEYSESYNPGWNLRRRPIAATYESALTEIKSGRRQQLEQIIRLYSDEAYYALWRQSQELGARNGNRFVEGTADARRSQELFAQMDARARALGVGGADPPPDLESLSTRQPHFPPETPGPDEVVLSDSTDPVVERCASSAEWMTIASDSHIAGLLITRSPEWGIIWRADLAGGDTPAMRYTCTANSTSSRPADMGGEPLAPLPAPRSAPGAP